jgi:hypothetical protein
VDLPRGDLGPILEREQRTLTDGAFSVVSHRLEFHGYCEGCRRSAPAAAVP